MTKLITVQFFRGTYGNYARSTDTAYPASSNGGVTSTKKKLATSLKRRMGRFYPDVKFIFNFTTA